MKSLQCSYPSPSDRRKRPPPARHADRGAKSGTAGPQPSKPQQQQEQAQSSNDRRDSAMGDAFALDTASDMSFGNEATVDELFDSHEFDPKLHLDAAPSMPTPSIDDLLQLTTSPGRQGDGNGHDDEDMHLFDLTGQSLLSPVSFDLHNLNAPATRQSANQPTASTTSRIADSPKSTCSCVSRSLLVLEEVEIQKLRAEAAISDSILACHKKALSQCEQLIACVRCSAASSSMVVLALLCDGLLNSFYRVVSASKQQQQQHQQQGYRHRETGGPLHTERDESSPRLFLGDYEIESHQEWKQLVSSLMGIQLKRLQAVMGRFRVLAECAGWETKLAWLRAQEKRLHETISHFRTIANDFAL
ncbi:C6 zinc finger domain-containing protein [Lasiodiplodia theobromae]|uniref:C6 zinc finger domain-containing protein n=1 Tax=Lasiodiplodia theobromae TaxID=45133 RepID=UPI0015C3CE96|nr:C6 zinc finger domain-containing protein [Lasiodiplodia theobromae]KAF4540634.1 C6 zinc finger domain-containing protein [Lasiodiplodia theobromae]